MKISNALIITIFAINLSSCSNQFGIGIHSFETKVGVFIPSENYREKILGSSPNNCPFFTIQRVSNEVMIRKRSCTGSIISKKTNPIFSDIYESFQSLAVAEDGNEIAYYHDGNIILYDMESDEKDILIDGIEKEIYLPVHHIEFISDKELIVVAKFESTFEEDLYSIVIIDLIDKQIRVIFDQFRPALPHLGTYAIAKKKRIIAFFHAPDRNRLFGDIIFLDLDTQKVLDTILNTSKSFFGYFAWSPNEEDLAYIKENSIVIHSTAKRSSNTISKISETKSNFNLIFLTNKDVLYKTRETGPISSIYSINIVSGNQNHLFSSNINGRVKLIDNHQKIIYENGF